MIVRKLPLDPGLWLVGVPIGTARDITLRALDVLASADILVAEDTRSLRKLLDIHGISLGERRISALHDHSGDGRLQSVLAQLASGASVAYASEAGMPTIADPGFELVRAAQENGIKVTSAPGPTALTTALALSGLATDAVHFAGFLPNTSTQRRNSLSRMKTIPATLVFYESPKRIAGVLADASDVLGPERQARLCRELTKKFEEISAGTLAELAERARAEPPKGEIVLLIARPEKTAASEDDIRSTLRDALQTMSVKDASAYVATCLDAPRRDVYQMALKLKDSSNHQ